MRLFVRVFIGENWELFGRHLLHRTTASNRNGKVTWKHWECVFCKRDPRYRQPKPNA